MYFIPLKALWSPLRHLSSVFTIFWVQLVVIAVLFFWTIFTPSLALKSDVIKLLIAVDVVLSIYLAILFVCGLVRWHRKLILDEAPDFFYFIPKSRDWSYFQHSLVLSLITFTSGCLILLGLDKFLGVETSWLFTEKASSIDPVFDFAILAAVGGVFCLILRQAILSLPMVATETPQTAYYEETENKASNKIIWPIILFLITAIGFTMLTAWDHAFLSYHKTGQEIEIGLAYTFVLIRVLIAFYAVLVFVSGISLYYRDYIKAYLQETSET